MIAPRNIAEQALRAARVVVQEEHDSLITGYAHPEKTERAGVECLTEHGYFFHVDTITDRSGKADLKRYKRVLGMIDAALSCR